MSFHLRLPAFPVKYGRVPVKAGQRDGIMVLRNSRKSQTNEGKLSTASGFLVDQCFNPFPDPPWVYLSSAFLGRRGGIRWKFALAQVSSSNPCVLTARHIVNDPVAEINPAADKYCCQLVPMGPGDTDRIADYGSQGSYTELAGRINTGWGTQIELVKSNNGKNSFTGTSATYTSVNPTLEIEIPFYRKTRYTECAQDVEMRSATKQVVSVETYYDVKGKSATDVYQRGLTSYVATGEDFSLLKFVNCPNVYFYKLTGKGA